MNRHNSVNCSPYVYTKKHIGCFSDQSLHEMRDLWNARHPDAPITTKSTADIYRLLKNKMSNLCTNELCWFEKSDTFRSLSKKWTPKLFAPRFPSSWIKNPTEWLSSTEISAVMKQYEDAYPHFIFIGPSPIDFDTQQLNNKCVWPELCQFSLKDHIQKNIQIIGVIFNTDKHNEPGQHWISLVIDIPAQNIIFFDSTGEIMPPEVRTFINRVVMQGTTLSRPIKFIIRDTKGISHQKGSTECGMYSLFFIINMITRNITWRELRNKRITDEHVKSFRYIYFNAPDK